PQQRQGLGRLAAVEVDEARAGGRAQVPGLAQVVVERQEGMSAARAALSAESHERLREGTQRLSVLIRQFFRLAEPPPG
ncbi:MAG: hypothetical protein ACKOSS_12545, partial [Planctomycetia bacterium]